MRGIGWLLILIACKPSALVENTMPVANLQAYRSVGLRVRTSAFASQGQATQLENAVTARLRQQCGFDSVGKPGTTPTDIVIDLNITSVARGGGDAIISNPNLATIHTLLVLSDGQDGEPLGTAKIRGRSSGMIINNSQPEVEAIDIVAKTVVDLLAKSGCSGPRVARAIPEPTPPPDPKLVAVPPPLDEKTRAEAEALNENGKEKLYAADIPGATAAFQKANLVAPDPRYAFNLCVAFGAQEKWNDAITACQQAKSMNPDAKLSAKIDTRLGLLQRRQ